MPTRPPTPCVQVKTGPELEPWRVSVAVFNGGSRSGLANRQGTLLRQAGFNVTKVSNSKDRIRTTVIVGAAADSPEVVLVASYFVSPEIRGDGRADHSVDVFVGNDFPGNNEKPAKSVPAPGGQVCLPADSPTAPPK